MRVYISGKIGVEVISEADRQKFARAEEMLKAKGYEVFNPLNEKWIQKLKDDYERQFFDREMTIPAKAASFYAYCLLRNLMALATKDAVFFLDDWNLSGGSRAEESFAEATCKRIFFQEKIHVYCYLSSVLTNSRNEGHPKMLPKPGEDDNDVLIRFIDEHFDEAWLPL